MTPCPRCGGEIADQAAVCKHCGAALGLPRRPKGLTAIAIVTLALGALGMLSMFESAEPEVHFGIGVPATLEWAYMTAMSLLFFWTGVGILRLKYWAARAFCGIVVFISVDATVCWLVDLPREVHTGVELRAALVGGTVAIGAFLGVAVYVWKRRHFCVASGF